MAFELYKPKQGRLARISAAAFLLAITFFASWEAYQFLAPAGIWRVTDREGTVAAALGIGGSVERGETLVGRDVNSMTPDTPLGMLNGGKGLSLPKEAKLAIMWGESNRAEIDVSGAVLVGDVLRMISDLGDLEGRISSDGDRIVIEASRQGVEGIRVEQGAAAEALKLSGRVVDSRGALVGGRLVGELSSTPLAFLGGGHGVGKGAVEITDRGGRSYVLEMPAPGVGTVGDFVNAVNSQRLARVRAHVDEDAGAIVLVDRTGLPMRLFGRRMYAAHVVGIVLMVGGLIGAYFAVNSHKAADFLIETEEELRKVSWSSKRELFGSTGVVIVAVALLAAYLYVVDAVLFGVFNLILRRR